ncbi:MAG: outer membrane beta-barrel protein [Xanthobacteraceae bacterium]|nr:outer membrane beta-barrel protein [Xanthobacteraceae bacterium]
MAGACFAAASAQAAPPPKKPPPVFAPTLNWSGLYAGGNLGGTWSRTDVGSYNGLVFPPFLFPGPILVPGTIGSLSATKGRDTSVLGGAQAGYNWQRDRLVFGIEADVVGTGLRNEATTSATRFPGTTGVQTVTVNYKTSVDWMASLRGRVGYALDRTLLYGTGGLALTSMRVDATTTVVFGPANILPVGAHSLTDTDSHLRLGWTLGGGFAWAVDDAWSVGAEYRRSVFGRLSPLVQVPDGLGTVFGANTTDLRLTMDQVTVRGNYRFSAR